ncbi:MAG: ABC transporter ATP-binding protein/permease [Alphaproteobacteria bacterium]|nr:ABC transporter ATP-binding protein/permease [Alphaproteobacteria bacterium]
MFNKFKQKIKSSYVYKNYQKMWVYVKPYWGRALIAMLITIPIGAMDAVIAWALKPYMDVVMIQKGASYTVYIPLLIILFTLLQSILNYSATYLNTWVGQKISMGLKIDLYQKLLHYHAAFFDSRSSGEISYRFSGDVDTSCNGLLANLKLFTTRFFSSISLICVLFYNSWQLAVVAVIVLGAALYPLTAVKKRIKNIVNDTVVFGSAVGTHYNETFQGNRIIASYNLYDYMVRQFRETLQKCFKLGIKMTQRTGIMSPMMHFIVSIGVAVVIWLGSYLIVTKTITPGNFVSFIAALIMLYTPIKGIGNNFNSVQLAFMAMDRVFELLDGTPDIVSKKNAKQLKGIHKGIEYKNVCFEYVKDKPVLKNINLKIKKGETVAFVGNSGGGKTTMVNLLPRFYDVTSGSLMFDGTDVRDFDLNSLRDNIAVVFQDNFLFSGTIRDNMMLGNENATNEQVLKAVKEACLEEFVTGLDKGLDTDIGERGVLLSGGQKQRIAIARAFLKDAPIVVLDEATSALDNKAEAIVQQAVENLMKDRTVFIIAHRLSTVRHADKIAVINNGELVELGTHEELLQKADSFYASLYQTQLK